MTRNFSTQSVHAGEEKRKPYGAVTTPIIQTSTYSFDDTAEILDYMQRRADGDPEARDEYGRYGNPTQRVAERKLAALEGCERALLFPSGMAAITTALLTLLAKGDHLVMVQGVYRRTFEFADSFLTQWGIETSYAPIDDAQALEAAIRPNTRLIFAETPTNPYLRILDVERTVEIARQHNVLTMIDSTFATPLNLRPAEYGVDLVVHSATKYLGGHNDLLAGSVAGPAHLLAPIDHARGVLGSVSNPLESYLLIRGLKTLALRVERQNENGRRIAEYLEGHPAVSRVHYPGLRSHPDYAVAQRQLSGFGGVVSFELHADFKLTSRFIDRLEMPYVGPTLGGVESVVEQPAALFSLNRSERQKAGIKDNLVRYALGIEDAEDIITDLEQALRVIERSPLQPAAQIPQACALPA